VTGGLVLLMLWSSFYYLFRNGWVYRQRVAILQADRDAYQRLPSYETMMRRFWIWDAAKFIDYGESQADADRREAASAAARGRVILARVQVRHD
jgi:hypothetical protein